MTAQRYPISPPTRPARRSLVVVANEVAKGFRLGWSERLQILIEIPLFVSFVLLLGFTAGRGTDLLASGEVSWELDSRQGSWLFLGLGSYIFISLLVQKVFWRLVAEIQAGTLEQTYLSPLPPWTHIALGRPLASIAETAVVAAVLYGALSLFIEVDLHWRLDALIPLLFLALGGVGLALVIAGLALVWKRIELLNDLLLLAVMFFSGAATTLDILPDWTTPVSRSVFMTHAIAALRTIMLDGQGLPFAGTGGVLGLTVTAAGWFLAGVLTFRLCERTAMRRGALARY